MCYLVFDRMLQLPHIPALGKGIGISSSDDLCQHASSTSVATLTFSKYQCSYLDILQASLLRSCLHDKAKHALMQVQACSLYIHLTTIVKVIILLARYLKTLAGPITFCSGYGS